MNKQAFPKWKSCFYVPKTERSINVLDQLDEIDKTVWLCSF